MKFSPRHALRCACVILALASGTVLAAGTQNNEFKVGAPQIQQYLDTAFPREYDALGGLLTLTASDPTLTIPQSGERLQMAFSANAASAGGQATPVGRILMSSGLRYDSQAYALYLDQPTLDDVQPAAAGHRVDEQTRMLLNLWLSDYARKEPLYKLDPAMVASIGTLQVESARIEKGNIVVRLNQAVSLPDLGKAQD